MSRHPIVGDVRGTGYFKAIELVRDKATRETFSPAEAHTLLREWLSPTLFEEGLICRADDRGDPVIQLSPPLWSRGSTSTRRSPCSTGCSPAEDRMRLGDAAVLTVGELVAQPGLGLELGGRARGSRAAVRWLSFTERVDPTPWLSGGELMLTTGARAA